MKLTNSVRVIPILLCLLMSSTLRAGEYLEPEPEPQEPSIPIGKEGATFEPLKYDLALAKKCSSRISLYLQSDEQPTDNPLLLISAQNRVSAIRMIVKFGDRELYRNNVKKGVLKHPVVWPSRPVLVPIKFSQKVFTSEKGYKDFVKNNPDKPLPPGYEQGYVSLRVTFIVAQIK